VRRTDIAQTMGINLSRDLDGSMVVGCWKIFVSWCCDNDPISPGYLGIRRISFHWAPPCTGPIPLSERQNISSFKLTFSFL